MVNDHYLFMKLLDIFYPLVRRIVPLQTYRYAICGGLNMVFGWVLYRIALAIIGGRYLDLGVVTAAPHTAALYSIVPLTFTAGFLMNRNLAFTDSPLRTRTQFVRYLFAWAVSLLLDHLLLKLAVEHLHTKPLPSQIAATLIIAVFSYFMQKYFTFAGGRPNPS